MPRRPLRFGLKVAQMGGTYAEIRDAWLEADRLGFDTAWAHDHLLNQNDHSKSEDEGWTILASLLTESRRIRGGLMVTANTFRHPAVLAKIATTVDVVSHGRVEVGLGAGWHEDEHRQYGLPLPPLGERMRRLEEACQILTGALDRAARDRRGHLLPGARGLPRAEARAAAAPAHRHRDQRREGRPPDRRAARPGVEHVEGHARGVPAPLGARRRLLPRGRPGPGGRGALHPVRRRRPPERRGRAGGPLARVRRGGATHLIYTCAIPYSAAGARRLWQEVVTPLRG